MRTLNELYILLWDYIKDMDELNIGLCVFMFNLHLKRDINDNELQILRNSFKYNLPDKPNEYPYCFPDGETGTKQRKEFVLSMIEKTKQ